MKPKEMLKRMAKAGYRTMADPYDFDELAGVQKEEQTYVQAALRELVTEFTDHSDEGTFYWGMEECILGILEVEL